MVQVLIHNIMLTSNPNNEYPPLGPVLSSAPSPDLVGTWRATSYDGEPLVATPPQFTPSLQLGQQSFGFSDGCSSYGSTYRVEGTTLVLASKGSGVGVACAAGAQAQADVLDGIVFHTPLHFWQNGTTLILVTDGGNIVFQRELTISPSPSAGN